jgi:hypothetical protein
MGQIIASGNLKGGTGKTTIAVNLACALATRGLEVILLDVDPQASAWEWAQSGLLPIRVEAAPPINLTGGGRWLARAVELAIPVDVLIIDLPPVIVPAIASAMMIAHLIVVPVTPSAVDVSPTGQVLRMIRIARESRRDGRPKALPVPNRTDPGAEHHEATQAATACTSAGHRRSASTSNTSMPSRSAAGPAATPRIRRPRRTSWRSPTLSNRPSASSPAPGRPRPSRPSSLFSRPAQAALSSAARLAWKSRPAVVAATWPARITKSPKRSPARRSLA